ncbi:DUF4192 domain-containing protein [Micromonospora mangrovi]|uniref:DUF4192 domain-containing protein n=2 Tax=Micromonospora TaxID=1873 RepID=A0AAU7MB78_9ACTN
MNHHDLPARLSLASPADVLAAVPYLLGFHPTHSVVTVGLTGTKVTVVSRADLPDPAEVTRWVNAFAPQQIVVLGNVSATAVIVVGYGAAPIVTPVVDVLRPRLLAAGIDLLDTLRVTDGRFYSYQCRDPRCCPVDGLPFDPTTSATAVRAIAAGQVALPDRAALVASVAAVTGPARDAMTAATRRARQRLTAVQAAGGRAAVIRLGRAAVEDTFDRYRDEHVAADDEVAWLTVLLTHIAVRDIAWEATTGTQPWHMAVWTDLTRRADPSLAAAPASLLAFAAWREGLGALAAVALDRALTADPHYRLAHILDRALRDGIPPAVLEQWPSTGEPTA